MYGQLIVGKGAKNAQWRKGNLYNKHCHKNWISTCKKKKERKKSNIYFMLYTNINPKWFKILNIRPETITFLEENIQEKLHDIGLGNDFLDMKSKVQLTKAKLGKQDYIKLKSFCRAKETINRVKNSL